MGFFDELKRGIEKGIKTTEVVAKKGTISAKIKSIELEINGIKQEIKELISQFGEEVFYSMRENPDDLISVQSTFEDFNKRIQEKEIEIAEKRRQIAELKKQKDSIKVEMKSEKEGGPIVIGHVRKEDIDDI